MRRKREINIFSISFLDLLSGALGAVIILYITIPKIQIPRPEVPEKKNSQNSCIKEITDHKNCKIKLNSALEEIRELKKVKIKKQQSPIKPIAKTQPSSKKLGNSDFQVGFNFKGKRIVFILDISGSMRGERLSQVKAGLKMLIASMSDEFHIDIVAYPYKKKNFYPLWGNVQSMINLTIKEEVYAFLERLKAQGATPTRVTLKYVLSQYPEISDIVLLSDGVPTIANKRKKDDINSIIDDINYHNAGRVQINTIGVGKSFLNRSNSRLYEFLEGLTKQTSGFFHGF